MTQKLEIASSLEETVTQSAKPVDPTSKNLPQIAKPEAGPVRGPLKGLSSRLPEKYRITSPRHAWSMIFDYLKRHPSFSVIVVIPTVLAVFYFGLIASDVYITESTFVLHDVSQPSPTSGIGSLLKGTGISGISGSDENLSAVCTYITSRDAMKQLDEKMNLKQQWSSWWIDPIQRFATLKFSKKHEHLYPYYKKHVTAEIDKESYNLVNLTVRGFTAQQSLQINELLLLGAEQLVNRLNERARHNMIDYAMKDVEAAQKMVKDASDKMTDQSTHVAYDNGPLAIKDAQYQQLVLDREIAKQQLASAMDALQTARNNALRQDLYLEVVSKPNLPDVAMEPRRLYDIISVLALSLLVWGVWTLFIAGVKEHQH
jgi:capsular polysaccharide transport system permease protein